jgi:hypothetical protein
MIGNRDLRRRASRALFFRVEPRCSNAKFVFGNGVPNATRLEICFRWNGARKAPAFLSDVPSVPDQAGAPGTCGQQDDVGQRHAGKSHPL